MLGKPETVPETGQDPEPGNAMQDDDTGPPRLDSQSLLRGRHEVIISHDGADYRLRLTSNGKLILTK